MNIYEQFEKMKELEAEEVQAVADKVQCLVGRWIKCDDMLPSLDEVVFLCEASGNIFIGQRVDDVDGWLWCAVDDPYHYKGAWRTDYAEPDDWRPVYWMPFPSLPNDKIEATDYRSSNALLGFPAGRKGQEMKIEDIKTAWNEQADEYNQWGEMDADERVEFTLTYITQMTRQALDDLGVSVYSPQDSSVSVAHALDHVY